jgi:hypothetical protein
MEKTLQEFTLRGISNSNNAKFSIRFYDVDRYRNNPTEKGNPIGGNANGMNHEQYNAFLTAQMLIKNFQFVAAESLMDKAGFVCSSVRL